MTKTQTTQHTPGPWTIDGLNVLGDDSFHQIIVAEVYTNANAHLIAAAPELLDALKALRDYIEEATGSIDPAGFSREDVEKILRFVKQDLGGFGHAGKAIAKAEGL